MSRKLLVTALVLMVLAPALQAHGMTLCQDGTIQVSLRTMRGVALMGTAWPMPCDGSQAAMVTGMYKRVGDEFIFSLYYDQDPTGSCLDGWATIGSFANGVGTGYWYNTVELQIYGPVTIRLGPCSEAAGLDFFPDLMAPVPGAR